MPLGFSCFHTWPLKSLKNQGNSKKSSQVDFGFCAFMATHETAEAFQFSPGQAVD
jgi:hypothetical protein